jgi:hypothetical protein
VYRGITLPALVLQAANLAQTATVQDATQTNGVFALTESTLLVGVGTSSFQAKIYTA